MSALVIADVREWRPDRRRGTVASFILSIFFHALLVVLVLLRLALFGAPGPGRGNAGVYRLAAGRGQDRLAAQGVINATLVHMPKPEPKAAETPKLAAKPNPVEKAKVEPAPNPKAKIKPRRKPTPKPVEEPQPVQAAQPPAAQAPTQEISLEDELAGVGRGLPGGRGQGGGGDAPETILNKKGTLMLGSQVRSQMSGRTFHLEMGRIDVRGGNRLINTVITLHPDGTSDVTLTHYFFQTYHDQYSSTRSETSTGHWWIEGNRWCHQSPAISYNTKDCYDLTTDGPVVRLYYAPCTVDSSQLCKSGRLAGEGEVK